MGPPRIHPAVSALAGAGVGAALALPQWGVQGAPLGALAGIAGICALLSGVHEWTLPRDRPKTIHDFWTVPRMLLACAAVLGGMLMQWLEVIPLWPETAIPIQGSEA